MRETIADLIRGISVRAEVEGDIVKEFIPMPKKKPPRRKHKKKETEDVHYMRDYMKDYRGEEGKDYQKKPDNAKELQKEQRKRLKEKFNIKGGSFS
jgi:hypothetical protein